MANRVLRDWTFSENIDLLSYGSEVFFTRLIMKADDFGRFYASPKLLKAALFPLKEISQEEISQMVFECAEVGIIKLYSNEQKQYLQIVEFNQRLRVMNSKFPEPQTFDDIARSIDRAVRPERNEEKRKETEVETKKKETGIEVVPPSYVFDFKKELLKFGFHPDLVSEWLKVRKTKKAVNTETALKGFLNEVMKIKSTDPNSILRTCIERSWSGFKSEWLTNINSNQNGINNNQQNGANSADQKITDYTAHVLSAIGRKADGSESKQGHEDGSNDFTEFVSL